MCHRETGHEVVPALYFVRFMNRADYSPSLLDVETDQNGRKQSTEEVLRVTDYADEFQGRVAEKLSELFDPATPFTPCQDLKTCVHCPFRELCDR
jgi:hypothetical protein